jgi:tryptophan synthase alpha chain
MRLDEYIRDRRGRRDILLMTHIVIGYPSLEASFELAQAMVEAGVDLMELQIPFSEPIADGPVILHANQAALQRGTTVEQCFALAERVAGRFPIPFLFMSYYNILFKHGLEPFAARMAKAGLRGAIVPDCPPEEAADYLVAMEKHGLDPIFIFSPRTPDERLRLLGAAGRGFVYVVARKGVTGTETAFSADLGAYLARCRAATPLPLAVGFGVKERRDVDFLVGKADIAVVGTQTLRIVDEQGIGAVTGFLRSLRSTMGAPSAPQTPAAPPPSPRA